MMIALHLLSQVDTILLEDAVIHSTVSKVKGEQLVIACTVIKRQSFLLLQTGQTTPEGATRCYYACISDKTLFVYLKRCCKNCTDNKKNLLQVTYRLEILASFEINTGKEIGEKRVIKMHKSQNLHTGPEEIFNLKDETKPARYVYTTVCILCRWG